jgi:hypothetical protein
MIIQFTEIFSLKIIKAIVKINHIKHVFHLNKNLLLYTLNNHKVVTYIQRKYRNKLIRDEFCPISHEILKYPFISLKSNGLFFYYDFYTLVEYLNTTEDFRDPCTRQVISDSKLSEINKMVRYYYGKNTNKILISQNMVRLNELNIITYCLYDLISEIDNTDYLTIDNIYNNILPRFIYYIHFLIKNHSRIDAITIINACKESVIHCRKINTTLILDYINLIFLLNFQE